MTSPSDTSPADAFGDLFEREVAAANASADARERALDEHGYGRPGEEVVGLADFVPADGDVVVVEAWHLNPNGTEGRHMVAVTDNIARNVCPEHGPWCSGHGTFTIPADDLEPAIIAPPGPTAHRPTYDPGEPTVALDNPITARIGHLRPAIIALQAIGYTEHDIEAVNHPFNGRMTRHVLVVRGIPAFEVEVRHETGRYVVTPCVLTWPRPAAERA